jgi:hypothetical protein
MSIYSTTALPSLDLLGGVETIQRLLKPHTEITKIAWDEQNSRTVAVLKTQGAHNALNVIAEAMKPFDAPLLECRSLAHAVTHAKALAHSNNVVDFEGFDSHDPYRL